MEDDIGTLMMRMRIDMRGSRRMMSLASSTLERRWPIPGVGTKTSSPWLVFIFGMVFVFYGGG